MDHDRELAIVRTVIYASLFDYPLTLDQLHQTLIESEQTPEEILAVYDGSDLVQAIVDYRDGFFFPAGRADLVAERRSPRSAQPRVSGTARAAHPPAVRAAFHPNGRALGQRRSPQPRRRRRSRPLHRHPRSTGVDGDACGHCVDPAAGTATRSSAPTS